MSINLSINQMIRLKALKKKKRKHFLGKQILRVDAGSTFNFHTHKKKRKKGRKKKRKGRL